LVWFAEIEKRDVVARLLTEGANVNMISSSGDSAILMAIEALNIRAVPFRSLDDTLFDLLSKYPHGEQTINRNTDKKRLLPLISAVETGRPDIVEKVLAMGARVNQRGLTDNQTALNVCLKMIGIAKDPKTYWQNCQEMELTPEVLDSFRRLNPSMSGFSLEDQLQFISAKNSDPSFRQILGSLSSILLEELDKRIDIVKMRLIAAQLIHAGADVDAEHTAPVKGYTPLMLAAELDEVDLFNKMISKGGDPWKTYYCKNTKVNVDCTQIAEYFRCPNVLAALHDIKRFSPVKKNHTNYH
jgi:hypothetical protein